MKAMLLRQTLTGSELHLMEKDEPTLGEHDILISVKAASVNRADLLQRAGNHQPGAAVEGAPVGLDAAGDIQAIGSAVSNHEVGDRVMSLAAGGLSERVVVDSRLAVKIPSGWTYAEGAAAVLGLATEHNALRTMGKLMAGESVLIHAASSGVGLQGVQIASYLGSGSVIATTRNPKALPLLKSLGADHVIDPTEGRFADKVHTFTNDRGVDVIVDHVGGPYLGENLAAAAIKARLIGVGRLGGAVGELDMEVLAFKRLEIIGVTFRTRSTEEKADIIAAVASLLDEADAPKHLRPTIDRVVPWVDVEVAQSVMEANEHLGKIVLAVQADAK